MANSDRRYTNSSGKTFMPMNVEGSNYADTFMTTPKVVTIVIVIASAILVGVGINNNNVGIIGGILWYLIWFIACSFPIRYIVFEERTYYKMYKELKRRNKEVTTPSDAWDIASIKDTQDGAILTYASGRVAVVLRVYRDTITGKPQEFEEQHGDAISDFYRVLMTNKYSVCYMNLMEGAGKDSRIQELDKLTLNRDNLNSVKLVQYEVGYIKSLTQRALFETDYFLIYSNDITKVDTIISDTIEAVLILLDGAYNNYEICTVEDISEIEKELTGVGMFNINEASLSVFNNNASSEYTKTFDIEEIEWANGETQELSNEDRVKLNNIINKLRRNDNTIKNYTLQKQLYRESKNKFKVDFDDLSSVNGQSTNNDEYIDF